MTRKCHVRFGGGPGEKEPCYLACGLPYDEVERLKRGLLQEVRAHPNVLIEARAG
jgi:hypothetical protein